MRKSKSVRERERQRQTDRVGAETYPLAGDVAVELGLDAVDAHLEVGVLAALPLHLLLQRLLVTQLRSETTRGQSIPSTYTRCETGSSSCADRWFAHKASCPWSSKPLAHSLVNHPLSAVDRPQRSLRAASGGGAPRAAPT